MTNSPVQGFPHGMPGLFISRSFSGRLAHLQDSETSAEAPTGKGGRDGKAASKKQQEGTAAALVASLLQSLRLGGASGDLLSRTLSCPLSHIACLSPVLMWSLTGLTPPASLQCQCACHLNAMCDVTSDAPKVQNRGGSPG
jgi:hypothetical protein